VTSRGPFPPGLSALPIFFEFHRLFPLPGTRSFLIFLPCDCDGAGKGRRLTGPLFSVSKLGSCSFPPMRPAATALISGCVQTYSPPFFPGPPDPWQFHPGLTLYVGTSSRLLCFRTCYFPPLLSPLPPIHSAGVLVLSPRYNLSS